MSLAHLPEQLRSFAVGLRPVFLSRLVLSEHIRRRCPRQLVAPLVFSYPGVAFNPNKPDVVDFAEVGQ